MSNTWLLIKNYFRNYLGAFGRSKNKLKYGAGGILILFIGLMFIGLFTSMAISTMESALKFGTPDITLYVAVGMLFMFFLLMTISRSTSSKKNNDDELLLALPLKKSQIVISKIMYNYLFDLVLDMGALIPSFVVYYYYVTPGVGFIIRSALLLLLIPMLSNAIGALLGLAFQALASRFKSYGAIQSLISVFFLVVFMGGYYLIQYYVTTVLPTQPDFSMDSIWPLKVIVDFILGRGLWLIYGIGIILICLVPFVICVIVKAANLGKQMERYRTKKNQLDFTTHSLTKTLLKQELGRYFNCSTYVMNTLFGGVVIILISLVYLVIGPSYITDRFFNETLMKFIPYIKIIVVTMSVLMTSTIAISASSISIEGKQFWILKANPISTKKIFDSKILANFIVCLICSVIAGTCFGIRFIIDDGWLGVLYMLAYILVLLTYSLLISILGLLVNLMFPKMEWDNEISVVKQSLAMGLGLIGNSTLGLILFVPYLFLFKIISPIVYLFIMVGMIIIIISILYLILNKKGKKLFEKI